MVKSMYTQTIKMVDDSILCRCVIILYYYISYMSICLVSNISNTRNSVSSGYPNTEKRVEKTTRSGVFLTKLEVFG